MSNPIAMGAQLAANAARLGWFYGINRMLDAEARRLGQRPSYKPKRPVPTQRELMVDAGQSVPRRRGGRAPRSLSADGAEPGALVEHLARVRAMLADLPGALARRASEDAASVQAEPGAAGIARLLRAGFPLPDRRLSVGAFRPALRRAGRDAVLRRGQCDAAGRTGADRARDRRPRSAPPVAARRRLRHGPLAAAGAARLARTRADRPRSVAGLSDEAERHMTPLRPAALGGRQRRGDPAARRKPGHRHVDLPVPRAAARGAPPRRRRDGARAETRRPPRLHRQPADGRPAGLGRPARGVPRALPRALSSATTRSTISTPCSPPRASPPKARASRSSPR